LAQQELAHSLLPGAPLRVEEQQLADGEPDGVDLGPDQVRRRGELVFGERGLDLVGEALQVAGALGAAELDDLLAAGRGGLPALAVMAGRAAGPRRGLLPAVGSAAPLPGTGMGGAASIRGDDHQTFKRALRPCRRAAAGQMMWAATEIRNAATGEGAAFVVIFKRRGDDGHEIRGSERAPSAADLR
jgi:hypothetical protein